MMNDPTQDGQARAASVGLCGSCAHVQLVTSVRGSRFYLCRLSFSDPRFARYPVLPVMSCEGYTPDRQQRDRHLR